jgi:uncharacterized membrane protein (UPF0127 family)
MIKTITIPKVSFEKALKDILTSYPIEAVKVSITSDYNYIIEAGEAVFTEINQSIGTKIHFLQQVQEIIRESI